SPPAAKNVSTLDDDATRLLQVGPPNPVLAVHQTVALLTDADGNGVVSPGDTLRYAVIATNTSASATGASVFADYEQRLPDDPFHIPGGGPASGGVITWSLGTLDANASVTLFYDVPVSSGVDEDAILGTVAMLSADNAATVFDNTRVPINVNDDPNAVNDSATTDEDTAVVIAVLANDSAGAGAPLPVTAVSAPSHGAAAINADGTVTYTPAANFHGSDAFSYTISDGHGGSATADVAVTVASVNDAPVAQDDSA